MKSNTPLERPTLRSHRLLAQAYYHLAHDTYSIRRALLMAYQTLGPDVTEDYVDALQFVQQVTFGPKGGEQSFAAYYAKTFGRNQTDMHEARLAWLRACMAHAAAGRPLPLPEKLP